MIQKSRTRYAWICAGVSLVVSFLFWTAMVSRYAIASHSFEGFAHQQVWEALINDVEPDAEPEGIVESDLHASATTVAVATDSAPTTLIQATSSEAAHWGLQKTYGLSIPAISVRAPVLLPNRTYWNSRKWDMLEQQMQVGLRNGLVAYPHSATPSEDGSLIIAGHSSPPDEHAADSAFADVFARLPELTSGDKIIVHHDSSSSKYAIEDIRVVDPTETSILRQQDDESIVKLITCYPVGTTKQRMVITAKRV